MSATKSPAIVETANAQLRSSLTFAKGALESAIREITELESRLDGMGDTVDGLDTKATEANYLIGLLAGVGGKLGLHAMAGAMGTLRLARAEVAKADKR